MNPNLKELFDYPETKGKKIAMKHYNWQNLTKVEEVMKAHLVLAMAKSIDEEN